MKNSINCTGAIILFLSFIFANTVLNAQVRHTQNSDARSSQPIETSKQSTHDVANPESKSKIRHQPDLLDKRDGYSKKVFEVDSDIKIKKRNTTKIIHSPGVIATYSAPGNETFVPEEEILFEINKLLESSCASCAVDIKSCQVLLSDKFFGKVDSKVIASMLKAQLIKNEHSKQ
jgi:hypothetical protein